MFKSMTKTTLTPLAPTILLAAIVNSNCWAAEDVSVDTLIKPSSSVATGVGGWSNDRPQLGGLDGMRKQNSYLLLDADIRKRDEATGTWQNLIASDLGTANRELRVEFVQQGQQGFGVEYRQFRSELPYIVNTRQQGIGSSAQTTGTNITNTTIGAGSDYQFGTDRTKGAVSYTQLLSPRVDFNVKLSTEDKKGNRLTNNGSALFVADPIDWTTHMAEAIVNYQGDSLALSGGYMGSWYRNNSVQDFVDLNGGATRTTQPLDNQAHQLFLSGTYKFTPTASGNFKLSRTRGTQDDRLPTAGILSNSYANIASLKGLVDTTVMQLGLTAKPWPRLGVTASFRVHDLSDKTPQYTTVRSTNNAANISVNTTPYSYTTRVAKLEGTYQLPDDLRLTAGVDYSSQNRSVFTTMGTAAYNAYVPMRSQLVESTYRLQVARSLSDTLNGSLAYLQGRRWGGEFTGSTQVGTAFVSPVNTADRDRQKIRLALDWAPADRLDVQLSAESGKDQYGSNDRSQGLREGNASLLSLDVSYQISERWQVAGWSSVNSNTARFSNYGTATNTLLRTQRDTGEVVGVRLTGTLNGKTRVGAEISLAMDKTVFDQSNSNGTATGAVAPDITSTATQIKLYASYALEKSADLRFDLGIDKWQTNDWQWNYSTGLPFQFGTATDGTTILAKPKQDATYLGARYIHRF